MPLKFKIKKLDEVAEAVRGLYRQEGEWFVLDTEGAVDKERLDEFRNNNIQLQQQLDKLKDIDPAKYRELTDLQRKLQERELIEKGEVEKVVELRVGAMREDLTGQLTSTKGQLEAANAQLGLLMIDGVVKDAAIKLGVVPTAVDDVVLRARAVFKLENGAAVPKNAKGETIYGKDGQTPMAAGDWVTDLKKTAPHLFQGAQGTGAAGGGRVAGVDMSKASPIDKINAGLQMAGMLDKLPG